MKARMYEIIRRAAEEAGAHTWRRLYQEHSPAEASKISLAAAGEMFADELISALECVIDWEDE